MTEPSSTNWQSKANRMERNALVIGGVGLFFVWSYPDEGGRIAAGVLWAVAGLLMARCTWIRLTGGK